MDNAGQGARAPHEPYVPVNLRPGADGLPQRRDITEILARLDGEVAPATASAANSVADPGAPAAPAGTVGLAAELAPPPRAGAPSLAEAPGVPQPRDDQRPVPKINDILIAGLTADASDVHLTTGAAPMVRVSGDLTPLEGFGKLNPGRLQPMLYAMLTQKQRENFETNLELDFAYSVPGRARFRVNVYRQRESLGAAFRRDPVRDQAAGGARRARRSSATSPACRAVSCWSPARPARASRRRWRRRRPRQPDPRATTS